MLPNGLEKYMAFMLGKNLVFTDTMQFMISSLEKLVKHLPEDKVKYFSQEIQEKEQELVKQKGIFPWEFMNKNLDEPKFPKKENFYYSFRYIVPLNISMFALKIMSIIEKLGMNLKWRWWEIIMIWRWKQMFCC